MKTIIFIACVIVYSDSIFGQSKGIAGEYQLEHRSNTVLKRTLILNPDGTFFFHNYENHEGGIPPEKNSYAKGTWILEKKVIHFYNTNADLDDKYRLSFNNSKARFDTKSPRDKSNRVVKTAIRFFQSDIFWIKGLKLLKRD